MANAREFFEFINSAPAGVVEDLDAKITRATRFMGAKVGLDEPKLQQAIERELSRKVAANTLDYLTSQGVDFRTGEMLDLGAGLGMLSTEAASRGAWPIAIEPGSGWREVAAERISKAGAGGVVAARGERLPFRDSTFDVVISLQVLEHVEDPQALIRDAFRVLKPGGFLYLTCENYLCFRENHYQIFWLPLMPKRLGAMYLRLRGKPPEFLETSVTYTTLPGVLSMLRRAGFVLQRDQRIRGRIAVPASIRRPWMRALITNASRLMSAVTLGTIAVYLDQFAHLCQPIVNELAQKPAA